MNSPNPATSDATMWRRQAIEANVIPACRNCGAPGVYQSDPRIKAGWVGCWVEPPSPLEDHRVGSTVVWVEVEEGVQGAIVEPPPAGAPVACPNCGFNRPSEQHLGEIWSKEFR